MYKMAVFDIDGTLTVRGDEIPDTALEAIKKLRERGIHCLIATGRERRNMEDILEATGIENYVACNGHYVNYQEEVLYRYTYPKEVTDEVRRICQREGHCYGFSNGEGTFISDLEKLRERFTHPMLDRFKVIQGIEEEIENIIIFAMENIEDFKVLEEEYNLVPWGDGMYDVLKRDRSKAVGIEEIRRRLGVKQEEIICFGDGYNDMEMIEYAGMGVAMGNGREELRKIADYVTDSVDNHGIYNACKKFGLI